MPQVKKCDIEKDLELPAISDQEYRFVLAILQYGVLVKAFREIFPERAAKMTPASVYAGASELAAKPSIQAWVQAGRMAHLQNADYTLERHVKELDELAQAARRAGNYGAAAQCRIHIGKASGLYVDKYEDVTKRRAGDDALLNQIKELLGDDAANQAAARLGLESDEVQIQHTSDTTH